MYRSRPKATQHIIQNNILVNYKIYSKSRNSLKTSTNCIIFTEMSKELEPINDIFHQIFVEQQSLNNNYTINQEYKYHTNELSNYFYNTCMDSVKINADFKKLQTSENLLKNEYSEELQRNFYKFNQLEEGCSKISTSLPNINENICNSTNIIHNQPILTSVNFYPYVLKKINVKKRIVRNANFPKFIYNHFSKQLLKNDNFYLSQQIREPILQILTQIQQWKQQDKIRNVAGLVHLIRLLGEEIQGVQIGSSKQMRKILHFIIGNTINKNIFQSKQLKHKISFLISTKAYRLRTFCKTLIRRIQVKSSQSVDLQKSQKKQRIIKQFKQELIDPYKLQLKHCKFEQNFEDIFDEIKPKQVHQKIIEEITIDEKLIQQSKTKLQVRHTKKILKFINLKTNKNTNLPKFLYNNFSKAFMSDNLQDQTKEQIVNYLREIQRWRASDKINNTPKLKHLSLILGDKANKISNNASFINRQFMHKLIRSIFPKIISTNSQLKQKKYFLLCSKTYALRCSCSKLIQRVQSK